MLLIPEVKTPVSEVKRVSGRILAKRLRKGTIDPIHCAQLALQLQRGEVVIWHLTAKQARLLTQISVPLLAAVRRVTPSAPRPRAVRNPAPRPHVVRNRVTYRRELSDGDLDQLVERVGEERLLGALDRATQPVNGGRVAAVT
jgi:hypothetical protein